MVLHIEPLFGKKESVKNLIFSILVEKHPLKLIQIKNKIINNYGKSVTFQAVRQAANELEANKILRKKDSLYEINPSWVFEAKKTLKVIEESIISGKVIKNDTIKGVLNSFSFNTINDMQIFWQKLIDNWFENFQESDEMNINCWQGVHLWEALIHLDTEKKVMQKLKDKGIRSYILLTGNTTPDKYTKKFYESIGIKSSIDSSTNTEENYYIGTYGDLIVQVYYPEKLHDKIKDLFKQAKKVDELNVTKLHDIITEKTHIEMTVIKNPSMARQINNDIISRIERK